MYIYYEYTLSVLKLVKYVFFRFSICWEDVPGTKIVKKSLHYIIIKIYNKYNPKYRNKTVPTQS